MRKLEEQFKRAMYQTEINVAEILLYGIAVACEGDAHQLRATLHQLPELIGLEHPSVFEIDELYRRDVQPYEIFLA